MSALNGEGPASRTFGPFTVEAVSAYADASDDHNPLHLDASVAARAGLPRPPVHGMLIMGCFERYLCDWQPGLTVTKLSAKFIRPVLVYDAITIAAKVVRAGASGDRVLRLMVKRGEDLVCLAEAFVRL